MRQIASGGSAVLFGPLNVYDSYQIQPVYVGATGTFRIQVELTNDGGTTWHPLKSVNSAASNGSFLTQSVGFETYVPSTYRVRIINTQGATIQYQFMNVTRSNNLQNGMIAFWKLDEVSGTRLDATTQGFNLTSNNNVGQAAGKVGNAAQFVAASTQYLSRAHQAELNFGTSDFTIAGWFYCDSLTGNNTIVAKYAGSGQEFQIRTLSATTNLQAQIIPGSVVAVATPAASIATATWYCFFVWREGDTVNIQIGSGTTLSAFVTTTGASGNMTGTNLFTIGATGVLANLMDGRVDAVGIWRRALTAEERLEFFNAGNGKEFAF